MDFHELLSVAKSKEVEAKSEASIKRYNTVLGPAKKVPKANIQSGAIRQFLAKKEAEERQKAEEARKKKEELLALRAQNTKNSKKAKIMASRTKDNDFSKIKLTDEEIEAKKKREAQLLRMTLNNKVERMKARIIMEEQEKLLPKKRKRKSKSGGDTVPESQESAECHDEEYDRNDCESYEPKNEIQTISEKDRNHKNSIKKPYRPPPSFSEILKLAAKKQYEPVEIPVIVDDKKNERPLTKKEKMLLEEEENRKRRKLEAASKSMSNNTSKLNSYNKSNTSETTQHRKSLASNVNSGSKDISHNKITHNQNVSNYRQEKKPVVVHLQRDVSADSKITNTSSSLGKQSSNLNPNRFSDIRRPNESENSNKTKAFSHMKKNKGPHMQANNSDFKANSFKQNSATVNRDANHQVVKSKNNHHSNSFSNNTENFTVNSKKMLNGSCVQNKSDFEPQKKSVFQKKINGTKPKTAPVSMPTAAKEQKTLSLDEKMLAEMERRIREQVQKELEAKLVKEFSERSQKNLSSSDTTSHISNASSDVEKKKIGSNTSLRTSDAFAKSLEEAKMKNVQNKGHSEKLTTNNLNNKLKIPSQPSLKPNNIEYSRTLPSKVNKELHNNALPIQKKHTLSAKEDIPRKSMPPPPHKPEKPRPRFEDQKPVFHPNPYLQPPRRRLESQRPQKLPPKRRIESDDDDDDEDMNDFIDDGPDDNLDYSKYIKEIFGYDRSKYLDDDDDDVMETSFAEQMKEEVRSAKIGLLEDLEDIKKEEEELRRKKKKKKLKK